MQSNEIITNGKIKAFIDSDLAIIVPRYLENRHKDLSQMQEALEQGNFAVIQMLGHRMKGTGSGYGFDPISNVGASLEQAAKEQNSQVVRDQFRALATYLGMLEIVWC